MYKDTTKRGSNVQLLDYQLTGVDTHGIHIYVHIVHLQRYMFIFLFLVIDIISYQLCHIQIVVNQENNQQPKLRFSIRLHLHQTIAPPFPFYYAITLRLVVSDCCCRRRRRYYYCRYC